METVVSLDAGDKTIKRKSLDELDMIEENVVENIDLRETKTNNTITETKRNTIRFITVVIICVFIIPMVILLCLR